MLLHSLLDALNKKSTLSPFCFRNQSQAIATQLVAQRVQDVLLVLPTGSGKTLCYIAPCFLEKGLITVILVPLIALMENLKSRIRRFGLKIQVFSTDISVATSTDVLLVAIEHVDHQDFHQLLSTLFLEKRLARIVVEECHIAVSWSWRPSTSSMGFVRRHPVPLVLLSATVPPIMVRQLSSIFNTTFVQIRECTVRKNIMHTVINLDVSDRQYLMPNLQRELPVLLHQLQSKYYHAQDRFIVYFMSVPQAVAAFNIVKSTLPCTGIYYGDLPEDEKLATINSWVAGDLKFMFATSAFGMGFDYPSVRAVVHFGFSYKLIDFVQAAGRAGRDGSFAESILFTSHDCMQNVQKYMKNLDAVEDFDEMRLYVDEVHCRQSILAKLIDGVDYSCLLSPSSALCDLCAKQGSSQFTMRKRRRMCDQGVFIITLFAAVVIL